MPTDAEYNVYKSVDPNQKTKTKGSICQKCGKGRYSDAFDTSDHLVCPKCGDEGAFI